MAIGCGFETTKTTRINMAKRPSTTTGADKGSGRKTATEKAKKTAKAKADAEAEDGSEETKAGRPDLTEAEKAEADAAEMEESAPVDKKIEELNETGEEDEDPEELERLKRKYMVLRFWQTARRFWTDPRSTIAWMLTGAVFAVVLVNLAASYAMNVWNREIFDALEKKNAGAVLYAVRHLCGDPGHQRGVRGRPGLRAHDAAAPLARMAERQPGRSLAQERPLLPAQSGQRRPRQSRVPHRRRRADRHRVAGRFRRAASLGLPVGGDLHRRAVDHRRRARSQPDAASTSTSRAFWSSRP